ncbi:MAG: hypothetical protein WDN46_05205 [Methylocella sp.]
MAAIIDPDELSEAQAQLAAQGTTGPGAVPPTAAQSFGAITDPDELAQANTVMRERQQSRVSGSLNPAGVETDPSHGQVMQAQPPKSFWENVGDVGRMLTSEIPFSDRIAAAGDTLTANLPMPDWLRPDWLPADWWKTGPGKSTDYAGNLRDERMQNATVEAAHPILSKILGFGGGAAGIAATAPESALAAGAGLGERALAGGLTGAGYGGVQGASSAPDLTDVGDAASRTARGAIVGLSTGAALPIAAGGIGSGYAGIADLVNGGAPGISRAAQKQLIPAIEADTPQMVQANLARLGDQGMLADAGPALTGKAQGASLNSDEGRTILGTALAGRDAGTNNRLNQDLIAAIGPAQSPQAVTDAIVAQRTAIHAPLPQIFTNAGPVDTSNVLADIGQRLNTARGPEAAVLAWARDYLMQDAQDAEGNPIRVPVTRAETLQNAKMAIDMLIDRGDLTLGVQPGAVSKSQGSIGAVRAGLNRALRDQVPGYADIMDRSSALARGADAIETGNSILSSGQGAVHPADLNTQMQNMTPEEIAGLRVGARGAIDRTVGTKANDLAALRSAMQGEGGWNEAKLASIFGAGPTSDIVNSIDRNTVFRNTNQTVNQGSQTAQRTAAAAAMKPGAATGGIPLINPNMTLTGALMTPVKAMGNALLNQMRPDPTRSYGEIARVLSAQGPQRDAYTSALVDALMRRGANAARGQAVGNNTAMAAALIGGPYANDRLQRPQ